MLSVTYYKTELTVNLPLGAGLADIVPLIM